MIGSLGREQGDDDFLALRLKCLLRPENIDRRDKADEEVHKALDKGDYGTGERGQQLLHVLQKRRGDPVVDKVVDFAERCIDVALDFGIILQNGRDPAVDTGIVCLRVVHDSDDALIQLRQQHGEECVQNQNGHDNADKDARCAAQIADERGLEFRFLFQQRQKAAVNEAYDRVQKKRDHHAEDQRLQNRFQRGQNAEEARQIRKDHDEQNADKDHNERCQTPFDVWLVPVFVHARLSFFVSVLFYLRYHIWRKTSIQRFS